jgi:hypothetical protein
MKPCHAWDAALWHGRCSRVFGRLAQIELSNMDQPLCYTLYGHNPLLEGPSRELSHRQAAVVIALMSSGLWLMLARLAAELC